MDYNVSNFKFQVDASRTMNRMANGKL